MMNKNDQQFMAQKIRTRYMEREATELDALRDLDARVKRPAKIFAYAFGSAGALIMGAGMSLVMTEVAAGLMIPGVAIGLVGMAAAIVNYPIYTQLLEKRKKRYAAEILTLSEKIMEKQ